MALFEITSTCKGGGYRYCRTNPPHPRRNSKGLYPLHRVLMEIKLGWLLRADEDVHHIDENKENNAVDNLEVKSHADHARDHQVVDSLELECGWCGVGFQLKPYQHRSRMRRNANGKLFCGRKCAAAMHHHRHKNKATLKY